jgi:UDP-N-acetylmuramate dehydrogenase
VSATSFEPSPEEPLAAHTSMGLGGPAQFFARLAEADAVPEAMAWARARGLPVTVLGGGSNVVVADAGLGGLVVQLELRAETVVRDGHEVQVSIGAGQSWDAFVAACVARGWAGLECLSGIPGRVGATPIQNVGAYGQEVADSLTAVQVYDCIAERRLELLRADCGFGYRTSRFKTGDAGRFIVLEATFRLREGGLPCVSYPEITAQLNSSPELGSSLEGVRAAVLAARRRKSMLLDPLDENARSCGSFFLNPQLDEAQLSELRGRSATPPPSFAEPGGRWKVPAAWLIEKAGFSRGQRWGAVGVSSRHTLALVCHEGATAAQVIDAAHRVRDGVAAAFGIWLEPEPRFLGFGLIADGLPARG